MSYRYCPAGVQSTVLDIAVDLTALPYLLYSFPSPHRAGVPSRLVLVGSDCASRRRAVSRGSVRPRSETWVRVRSGVWPGLPVGEAGGVGSERCSSLARPFGRRCRSEVGRCQKRALFLLCEAFRSERRARVGSGRRSSSARPSSQRLDCPPGLLFRCLGQPMSCALFATLSAGLNLCWEAGPRGSPGL